MQVLDHYIRLQQHVPGVRIGQGVTFALEELAAVLCCTSRNAKLVLKKWEDLNWVKWQPGRGRGNASTLVLSITAEDALFSLAQELVAKGSIREATALVERFGAELPEVQERFTAWLNSQFGFRREQREEKRLDTLRFPMPFDRAFTRLDPLEVFLRSECHLIKQIADGLVRYNAQTQRIEPHVAHAWEVDESGCEWTFYLRKGVLWHHGRELTAEDVLYTAGRWLDPAVNRKYHPLFAGVASVVAVDAYTVVMRMQHPHFLLLDLLCLPCALLVPKDYCEEMGSRFTRLPIGTGPFKLIRNDETMAVLEAFAPYFRERAFLDRIEFWMVPELQPSQAFERERYEIRYGAESPDAWQVQEKYERGCQYFSFNLAKDGPQQSREFREWMASLLAGEALIREVGGARGIAAEALHAELEPLRAGRSLLLQRSARPEHLEDLVLRLFTANDEDHVEDAEWIKARCAEAGVTVETTYLFHHELIEPEVMREADLILDGATVEERPELSYLDLLLPASSYIANHLEVELSAFVAEQLVLAGGEPSREARLSHLQGIELRLLEERMLVCLYRNRIQVAFHPFLNGVLMNGSGWIDYRSLWFKPSGGA
jgi:MarR-like DNA-binding transcriptional regulator SgrR of sgrS sRNA